MIKVSSQATNRQIASLVKELKYVSSDSFLRTLNLKYFEGEALLFLDSVFPKSGDAASHNLDEFGQWLFQGWKAEGFIKGNSIGFRLYHELESDRRAKVVLKSLDTGSRAYDFQPEETLSFPAKLAESKTGLGWVTLSQKKLYHYKARPGREYTSKTAQFIESTIMPEVKENLSYRIRERIKRVKSSIDPASF